MDTTTVREWYQDRLDIADAIVDTFGDEGLFDAEILLCCAMSALAARIWPGERIDRFRYVQLFVDFAPDPAEVKRISVPRLHEKLKAKKEEIASAQVLESRFLAGLEDRVLTGPEIDQSEQTLTALLPAISLGRLREASYAAILYQDLRCGLVHEYSLPPHMIDFGLSRRQDVPSYVNVMATSNLEGEVMISGELSADELETELLSSESTKRLYLPYRYVRRLSLNVAGGVFAYWDTASEWCRPIPQPWWLGGHRP